MAATVYGTGYVVGIGDTAFDDLVPVECVKESSETSVPVKTGDGVVDARVVKDTAARWTLRGPITDALADADAGDVITFTDPDNNEVEGYIETARTTRNEEPAQVELVVAVEAGVDYSP